MTLLRNALPGSDRENVRQAQGLATHLNPLRQITNRLPLCNCSRRSRYLLVMSPDPSTNFENNIVQTSVRCLMEIVAPTH